MACLRARHPLRLLDLPLLGAVLALAVFGCVAVYSSTGPGLQSLDLDSHLFLKRQLAYLAVAALVFGVTLAFDYRQLRGLGPVVYLGGVVLLVAVLTPLGRHVSGAQRWIDLGFFRIQPSELMKVVLVVALAGLFAERASHPSPGKVALAVGATVAPGVLVYLQPDLGTVLVLFAITFFILFIVGARARFILVLLAAAVTVFALAMAFGLVRDYQIARLTAFLDEGRDSQRAGYNLSQSKIAVGSGGIFGKGLFGGSQTNLDYVPEQHTDFIFTA
ncbi:MAG: FtsW/RodA/SpoVE family cell cycle protein, partial [Actinomycetota bacterium]